MSLSSFKIINKLWVNNKTTSHGAVAATSMTRQVQLQSRTPSHPPATKAVEVAAVPPSSTAARRRVRREREEQPQAKLHPIRQHLHRVPIGPICSRPFLPTTTLCQRHRRALSLQGAEQWIPRLARSARVMAVTQAARPVSRERRTSPRVSGHTTWQTASLQVFQKSWQLQPSRWSLETSKTCSQFSNTASTRSTIERMWLPVIWREVAKH